MICPACHRTWNDLDRHLAFAHQEVVVMQLRADDAEQPLEWAGSGSPSNRLLPALYALLALALLAAGGAA